MRSQNQNQSSLSQLKNSSLTQINGKKINKDLEDVVTERIIRPEDQIYGEYNQYLSSQIPSQANDQSIKVDERTNEHKEKIEAIQSQEMKEDDKKTESLRPQPQREQSDSQIQTRQIQNQTPNGNKPYLFYVYGGNYPETVVNALMARGNWQEGREEDNLEKCHLVWRPFNYPQEVFKRIDNRVVRSNQILIYNHFEILKGLVTKSGLIRSLKQYYYNNELARQAGYSIFDSTPTTFLIAAGVEDAEYNEFVQRYKDIQKGYAPKERIPIKHCVNNIWLVKPANANQGRGIEIFSDLDDITSFTNTRPQFTCCVVQKYVERPLLFKGRKFDIRVWAFFTSKNEVFFYKHGYLRTSSDDYNLKNGNNYVHLTNNCLQKFGDNYGVHEDGNTIGFHALQQYLDEMYPEYKLNVEEHFVPRMKDLIIDSFNATKHQLNPNRRKHCFELLGYDFLIDEDFRLWLIEINTNPYFGVPNRFIEKLLPKMMDDLLDILVDPIYPPANRPETLNTPNDFELLYCDANSVHSSQPVNKRRPFTTSVYPIPELAQLVGPKAPRQDLKYLRQFKISNLQLSTVSFKNTNNLPAHVPSKYNLRSKSLIPSKLNNNYSQYINTTATQVSSTTNSNSFQHIGLRASRSKSAYKNTSSMTHAQIEKNLVLQQPMIKEKIRAQSANRKSLYLKQTITSSFKQTNPFKQISQTPSNKDKDSGKIANLNNNSTTQRNTPRGVKMQNHFIIKKRDQTQSKSELANASFKYCGNTTKETSSLGDQISNTSSQDKFLFKKLRDQSLDKKDLTSDEFDKILNSLIEKIKLDSKESSKDIQTLIEKDKVGYIYNEQSVVSLLCLFNQAEESIQAISSLVKIIQYINYYQIDLLLKLSEKLQVRKTLMKGKALEVLFKQYFTLTDQRLKSSLLKMLTSFTCIQELDKLKDLNFQLSQKSPSKSSPAQSSRDVPGATIIKQQLFKRSLSSGLIHFLLLEKKDFEIVLPRLNAQEIELMIQQIETEVKNDERNVVRISTATQQNNDGGLLENTLAGNKFGQRQMITEPDTEEFNPCEFSDQQSMNPQAFTASLNRIDLSFDNNQIQSKSNLPSKRSQRLFEKEQRSNQDSAQESICTSPKLLLQSEANTVIDTTLRLILDYIPLDKKRDLLKRLKSFKNDNEKTKSEAVVLDYQLMMKIHKNNHVNNRQRIEVRNSVTPKKSVPIENAYLMNGGKTPGDSKKNSPNIGANKPFIITTPEKHLRSSDISQKETPPKENNRYKNNVLSNFIQPNASNRNISYSNSQMNSNTNIQYQQAANNSISSNKIDTIDEVIKQRKKYEPILSKKMSIKSQIIQNSTNMIKDKNEVNNQKIQKQSTFNNYIQQKSYTEINKSKRVQSRSSVGLNAKTTNDMSSKKFSQHFQNDKKNPQTLGKYDLQSMNDQILNQINNKINDIQQNLNLLNSQQKRRNVNKTMNHAASSNIDCLNTQTFESNESKGFDYPELQINQEFSSGNVNYHTSEGQINKNTSEIQLRNKRSKNINDVQPAVYYNIADKNQSPFMVKQRKTSASDITKIAIQTPVLMSNGKSIERNSNNSSSLFKKKNSVKLSKNQQLNDIK